MLVETDIQRIYNCKSNHHRIAIRQDYHCVTTWSDVDGISRPITTEYYSASGNRLYNPEIAKSCPSCGNSMVENDVYALTNEEANCDLKCMNAVGSKCMCSCGGPNHGISWLIKVA